MTKIRDTTAWSDTPRTRFRHWPGGPYVVTGSEEALTVVADDGRTAIVERTRTADPRAAIEQLKTPVPVTIDGQPVGHLSKVTHGRMRSQRVIHFTPLDPGRYPAHPHFRLRGIAPVIECRSGSRTLIAPSRWPSLLRRPPTVSDDVSAELVLIYVAVGAMMTTMYWP